MSAQKKIFLMPYPVQIIGWVLAGGSVLVLVGSLLFTPEYRSYADPVIIFFFFFLGLFLAGLSKEKTEDEFSVFLRTRSALTAVAFMFGLRIFIALALGSMATWADSNERILAWFDTESNARMLKVLKEVTSYGGAFILYLIIYKIRLAIYRKGSRDEE